MNRTSVQWLRSLLDSEARPSSTVPKSARGDIDNLIHLGFIERRRSGAGVRLHLANRESIQQVVSNYTYSGNEDCLTEKSKAVARCGDAHRGRDAAFILTLAGTDKDAIIKNEHGVLDVYSHTIKFGVTSIVARSGDTWNSSSPFILVENADLLLHANTYSHAIGLSGLFFYYSGQISGRFLEWLSESTRSPEYIMLPDYDVVGLSNYIRVKTRLGNRVKLHIPDNLEELIDKYGDKYKLQSSSAHRGSINKTELREVISVYKLLLKHGKTLHQEALLLD